MLHVIHVSQSLQFASCVSQHSMFLVFVKLSNQVGFCSEAICVKCESVSYVSVRCLDLFHLFSLLYSTDIVIASL
jgi:hypothetical protein